MLQQKTGFPEEGELVMCTITKIQYNSVFASLDEFNKQGMIHISEIAPGRIRNIGDYVKEGKVIVCKILRINLERGHIDLSLRRVTEAQRRAKVNGIKQEQMAEKILDYVCKKQSLDVKKVFGDLAEKLSEYDSLYQAFDDIVNGDLNLEKVGIDKKLAKELEEVIRLRIKPPEVSISGALSISSYEPDGVEYVRRVVKEAMKIGGSAMRTNYLGAGQFGIDIKSEDYKTAEKILQNVNEAVEKLGSKLTTIEFKRK